MPVPTSNQGAESKRWLVPLLAKGAHPVLAEPLLALPVGFGCNDPLKWYNEVVQRRCLRRRRPR